jgi:hypothetical protein
MDRSSNGSGKISIFNALILAILLTHVRGQEDAPTFSLYEGRINEKIKNNIELGIQKVFYYKLNDSVIQDPFVSKSTFTILSFKSRVDIEF